MRRFPQVISPPTVLRKSLCNSKGNVIKGIFTDVRQKLFEITSNTAPPPTWSVLLVRLKKIRALKRLMELLLYFNTLLG